MSSKRKIALVLGILLVVAFCFVTLLAGIHFYLPQFLESRILPELIAATGVSDIEFNIRRIGFSGADLGGIRIGPPKNPALVVRSVQLDYSPGELYRKKIDRVLISGIQAHGQLENGRLILNGIDLQEVLSNVQSRTRARPPTGTSSPPILVNRLEVRNAAALLTVNRRFFRIPFEVEITPVNSEYTLLEVAARMYPRGQEIGGRAKIDLTRHVMQLKAELSALELDRFSDLIQLDEDISAAGLVSMTATTALQWEPFQIPSLNADLKVQAFRSRFYGIQFQSIDSVPVRAVLAGRYQQDGSWQLNINGGAGSKASAAYARFQVNQFEVESKLPLLNLSGRTGKNQMTAAFSLVLADARMDSGLETIRIPEVILKGTANVSGEDPAGVRGQLEIQAPGTAIKSAAGKVTIRDVSLSGKIDKTIGNATGFSGLLRFGGGRLTPADVALGISNINGKIPLIWPPSKHTQKGNISVGSLKYKDWNLGRIEGSIRQTVSGFDVQGRHISELLPGAAISFEGSSRLFNTRHRSANLRFNLSQPAGATDIDLARFHPTAQGITVNGKLLISGNLTVGTAGLSGSLQSQVLDGKVAVTETKLAIEGINMSLVVPALPEVRSAPGQQLQFTKLSLGDLAAKNGTIDFQIESLQSLLIERLHFAWSGGLVDSQAMRISPGIEDYRLTFYCDRLNLARVLEQFGAAAAEGAGTVSGRIPIRYTEGKLSFDDGFLFSTPGTGGKIRLRGTEILTAGIPPDTPQFAQMELAREALKDYDYSWAKLRLNSEGENLLLQMQMDGKPAKTLPFVYSKDVGGFIRVEAESKGSRFQGIRLDVNFKLPLNKLLQYKDLIKMINN